MEPIYTPQNVTPAYQLNWGLTIFWRQPPVPESDWLAQLQSATEPDGVRVLKHRITTGKASQFFISTKPHVSPAQLIRSVKGRLQYLLHLVFVNQHRWCEVRQEILDSLLLMVERAAQKHGQRLSRAALLADHIHLTLGCEVSQSPEDVAISYLNNCAFAYGQKPVFSFGYYAGTMGEYDRGAV